MEVRAPPAPPGCPLCSERLDATAKVLPCQHTFCPACLRLREAPRSSLLRPECGVPARVQKVEDPPANALLVRLLEDLRGAEELQQGHTEPALPSGDGVVPKHKGDDERLRRNTCDGGGGGGGASIPAGTPPLQTAAQCRALRDFNPGEINLEYSKYCLSFLKGDVLAVVRRVDEHWMEAKLGDKCGICPLQFMEPNSAAAKLLEGKTQRGSESAGFQRRTETGGKDEAKDSPGRNALYAAPQAPARRAAAAAAAASLRARHKDVHFYSPTKAEPDDGGLFNGFTSQGRSRRLSAPPAARRPAHPSRVNSLHVRHHSDGAYRNPLQGEKKMTNEAPPNISMALLNPHMSSASAESKNSSTQQLAISVCAVLYSYKPRRPEELELRKGEMVGVYGKFKEGWLRGLSLRTGKVGILPGNYITPVLRTSARLLETRAANASSQYNAAAGKKHAAGRNPAAALAFDRANGDAGASSAPQVPSVPNGAQRPMARKASHGGSQGWDTVRRFFHPHKGPDPVRHPAGSNVPSNPQPFAQVQASGYSPALQRKRHGGVLSNAVRTLGWAAEPGELSAASAPRDRDFAASHRAPFQHDRHHSAGPHSILVRPDTHKNNADKPVKSVRFLTEEDPPPPRFRTSSWSSGSQVASHGNAAPRPLDVWAPSLTLGRDGPGIILTEGKAPALRKGLEMSITDLNSNPQNQASALSAAAAQFSPCRHRVIATHLAQTDSELSLLQGEVVLVHKPRPDGRVLVTQESSGRTGIFHGSVLQALERLS